MRKMICNTDRMDCTLTSMEERRFLRKYVKRIKMLEKTTHFSHTELEAILLIYYKFVRQHKGEHNAMTKVQFRDFLHKSLDMCDDNLMGHIMLTLDRSPTLYISTDVWINALSLFTRGTLEERIKFCFSVYDMIGEGVLNRDNIFYCLRNSMLSPGGEDEAEETVRDFVEVITKKMDWDRDGKVSFEDYRKAVLQSPSLLESFGQCLPTRNAVNAFFTTFTYRNKLM